MKKQIGKGELSRWRSNFTQNKELPFITRSVLIRIEDLLSFITDAVEQKADGVRIHFIRFGEDEEVYKKPNRKSKGDAGKAQKNGKKTVSHKSQQQLEPEGAVELVPKGCKFESAGKGVTQGSIALVPVRNFSIDPVEYVFSGEDIVDDDKITILIPGIDYRGTGHCPPCADDGGSPDD